MENTTERAQPKPAVTVIGVLTQKLRSPEFGDVEKMTAIRERIAARMSQIIGFLHHVMHKESDPTLHNLVHVLTSEVDDPEMRALVCADAANNPAALELAKKIEEGFENAGRNVRPRIAALEGPAERAAALKTLVRYVQHILALARQGERVRYMVHAVTGTLEPRGLEARARNASNDPDVIELFFHLERGLVESGVNVNPEMPALREMFAYYAALLGPEDEPDGQ